MKIRVMQKFIFAKRKIKIEKIEAQRTIQRRCLEFDSNVLLEFSYI
jgi:hypothetical protein